VRCFYHGETEAVGTCKNCCRGLCRSCAVDVSGSLACRDHCEKEVETIVRLMAKSKTAVATTAATMRRNAIFYALSGVIFGATGLLSTSSTLILMFEPLAVLFLLMGLWSFSSARKYSQNESGSPSA